MPILSYLPVCSKPYDKPKNVRFVMQNHFAGLPMLCFSSRKVLTTKALRSMYFYVSVAGC